MFATKNDPMYTTGYITALLYLASLTFFTLSMYVPHFFAAGIAIGTLVFIVSTVILGTMVKKRIET